MCLTIHHFVPINPINPPFDSIRGQQCSKKMAIDLELELPESKKEAGDLQAAEEYMKGVRRLCEKGVTKVPGRYVLPVPDRPKPASAGDRHLKLPVIDLGQLLTLDRPQVLEALDKACKDYGFFRVVNHGVRFEDIRRMLDVGKRFFELPFEERTRYMSTDIREPVRCGTSFNQINDRVFCWRDFLKLNCHPLDVVLPYWPSSPADLREGAVAYVKQVRSLFLVLMASVLEALGVTDIGILREFERGTHLMVVNCYPACPEPDLTLGMPPHSDYGFLTLLLQDDVEGLQVQYGQEWITVGSIPNSVVVNVGDHLEIFSNGRYKSALHRVLVNSSKSRISVASLHSLPYEVVVSPAAELVGESNPKLYEDTDFAAFLDYISSNDLKQKNFLKSRKLTPILYTQN